MLHTKETEISSGRLGLWLVCTFTLPLYNITIMNVSMHVFIEFW